MMFTSDTVGYYISQSQHTSVFKMAFDHIEMTRPVSQTKGIPVPSGSVRVRDSGILGPIGIRCDTWK